MNHLGDVHFGGILGSLATVAVLIVFLGIAGAADFLQVVNTLGTLAIVTSAYVGYRLYLTTRAKNYLDMARAESETSLKEAIRTLERAFEMFTYKSNENGVPPADRLLWLSVARMLIRFDELKEYVTAPDHQLILSEQEQYWRLRFYEVLEMSKDTLTEHYFKAHGRQGWEIDERSLLSMFAFSKWPANYPDPMDQVNAAELKLAGVVPIDQFGARRYLHLD